MINDKPMLTCRDAGILTICSPQSNAKFVRTPHTAEPLGSTKTKLTAKRFPQTK